MTDKEIERHLECIGCPHVQALLQYLLQHLPADKAEPEKDKSAKTTKTTKTNKV